MQLPSQEQENARVSGLLHDIGKLALLSIPEFTTRVPINRLGKLSLDEEYRVLKTSHSEIGGYLLGMWGLPTPIVDAITFHHRPYTKVKEKTDLLTALYLANGLSNMVQNEMEPNYPAYFDMAYIQRAGITGELDEWAEITRTLYTKSEDSGVS
jgi:HD-like signal output (HDOD) protein